MTRHVALRCDQMRRPDRDALATIALRRARAGPGGADIHVDHARGLPGGVLPAVNIAIETAGLGKQWRRNEIDHPAADPNAVVEALSFGRCRRLARIAGNGS